MNDAPISKDPYKRALPESLRIAMTVFQLKQLASTSVHAAADAIGWNYDRAELIADGVSACSAASSPPRSWWC
ncbi:hypothetical protein AB7M74_003405 [Bradyrhizobium japonicum]